MRVKMPLNAVKKALNYSKNAKNPCRRGKMLRYISTKQISIEEFETPFIKELDKDNRWAKLTKILPCDELVSIYSKSMSRDQGRPAIDPRVVIGSMIIKHRNRLSDEETIEQIKENPYLQYFIGLKKYTSKRIFDSSLFVTLRHRMGEERYNEMNDSIISRYETITKAKEGTQGRKQNRGNHGSVETGNKQEEEEGSSEKTVLVSDAEIEFEKRETEVKGNTGKLIMDATVAPADIKYPTDLDILNSSREQTEKLIDKIYKPEAGKIKPRTYRKKARKEYLRVIKQRKKSIKTIRKSIRKQLGYLNRNIKTIDKLLDEKPQEVVMGHKEFRMLCIVREVYRQQEEMYREKKNNISDRIVSIHQPQVRPIVRGKSTAMVEFGAKISVSLVNGFTKPHQISWDAYNEGGDLKSQVENYKDQYGFYPAVVIADKIYGTKENREYLKTKGIKFSGKKLGRPKLNTDETDKKEEKELKQYNKERNQVEGKFGEGKRRYGLDRIRARKSDTSESWISAIFFVMNIAVLFRNIFLSLVQLLFIFKNRTIKMNKLTGQNAPFSFPGLFQ
jgi:IS5 family transposase